MTFTATVAPTNTGYGTPTGSVEFYDETTGNDLGTGAYALVDWRRHGGRAIRNLSKE